MRKFLSLTLASVLLATPAYSGCGQGDLIGKWKIYSNSTINSNETVGAATRCNFEIDNSLGKLTEGTDCRRLEFGFQQEQLMVVAGSRLRYNAKCELYGVIYLRSPQKAVDLTVIEATGVPSAPTLFGMGYEFFHRPLGGIWMEPATYVIHRTR